MVDSLGRRIVTLFRKFTNFTANDDEISEALIEHYKIEKSLAKRLRDASREERLGLYSSVYDELFKRVPYHLQLMRKKDAELQAVKVAQQMKLLLRFLRSDLTFLEIGPGDCSLSFEVSKYVKKVYAIDVSTEITKNKATPKNFELIISDGLSIPVSDNSVDLAYSKDLVEHLHPDDFREQLSILFRKLASNGLYVCITPNRISGPHDISKYFDAVATGFHLKEYTVSELSQIMVQSGFSKIETYIGGEGLYLKFPTVLLRAFENILLILPRSIRKILSNTLPGMALLGITLIARKE
jgi:SAM-dependent methyltransferase